MGDERMTLQEQARETMEKGNIDMNELVDLKTIGSFHGNSEARLKSFITAIKNPYLFRVGDTAVHLEFSDKSSDTLQDKMCNLLLKSIG